MPGSKKILIYDLLILNSNKMSKSKKFVKICRVCGDKAIGYNFNCMTCESCKSFFRRNAFNYEKYLCLKNRNCLIDFVTRKCCTKCRLEKCFANGMRKELICIRTEIQMGRDVESFHRKKYSTELSSHELIRFKEIHLAHSLAGFFDPNRLQIVGESSNLIYALNLAETYIRKAVKFCKSFSAFKCLKQDDQLILLKSFFTELLIIRLAFVYDQENDAFPVIENENENKAILVKLNVLFESNKRDNLDYCRQNLSNFHSFLEEDATFVDLILAQRLFKPRTNLTCPEFITYQHLTYQLLLKRYLEHKYKDVHRALVKMNILVEFLKELNGQAKEIVNGIYCDLVDSSLLARGLNEVYK